MSTHDHDNDALPGEDELKALYRSLPRKEPSPELDRAVKRAAADAVRPARGRPMSRWPVAVASVAMVVVAAGLGWRMMQQPSSVPQIPTASSVPANPSPSPAMAPSPPPPPAPESQAAQAQAPRVVAEPAPTSSGTRRTTAAPLLPEHDNIRSAMKPKVMARATVQAPPSAPPPVALEESAPAAPMTPIAPAPQESAKANYSAMPSAVAPPAPPAPVESSAASLATPAPATESTTPIGGLRHAPAAMPVMAAPAPAPMQTQDATAPNPSDTPAQELEKIRQLFAQHRHDEAMQRLAAFQKAHPDTPLPDDLQAQLPDHE